MNRALQAMLRAYQRWLSPLLPPACRYQPTCSEYALQALAQRGLVVGLGLAAWRLLRCHPFVRGGYDPVPLPRHPLPHPGTDRLKH